MNDILLAVSLGIGIGSFLISIFIVFESEIDFQLFYFIVFCRITLAIFLWICVFGSKSFVVYWKYRTEDDFKTFFLPEVGLWGD